VEISFNFTGFPLGFAWVDWRLILNGSERKQLLAEGLVGWGLTALLTQNRSYRACRFVGIFYSKL